MKTLPTLIKEKGPPRAKAPTPPPEERRRRSHGESVLPDFSHTILEDNWFVLCNPCITPLLPNVLKLLPTNVQDFSVVFWIWTIQSGCRVLASPHPISVSMAVDP